MRKPRLDEDQGAAEREVKREKRKEITNKAARDTQIDSQQGLLAPGPSRITAFLQGGRPRGLVIPCKNAGILFRESSAEERSDDGAEKREKREERREKREDRREKTAERGENTEKRNERREQRQKRRD